MDQTKLNEGTAPVAVQPKKSVSKALERAALRELRNRKHEQYAAEDAADEAAVAQMRAARLAADDAARREAWEMNVEREMARAEGRADWVVARADAAELRRATRAEQRRFRKEEGPAQEARLAQARHEKNAAEDAYTMGSRQLDVDREMARAEGRAAWCEANERAWLARREYKKAIHKLRRQHAKADIESMRGADERITSQAKVEDAREDAIRKAMKDHAMAVVELRDARRAGVEGPELEALIAREAELGAAEEKICADTRQLRLDEADERVRARTEKGKERVGAEAALREEWRELKDIADIEKRRVRAEEKARRKEERAHARAVRESMREERNAKVEAAREQTRVLLTSYQMAQADMQEAYLEANEAQRDQIRAIRASERAARPEIRARENEADARRRADKLAREDADAATFREMMKERAYARSLERDSAIDSTDVAYRAMCGDLDEKGVK